ncbi:MAG: DegT/DnrJ/EryC1/StrS family aminotransferase [Calditrichaeota bacterium]|nr:DegT/DnrJ/EryC1/StrS family aminotransferase [Calditrichota bacterium]
MNVPLLDLKAQYATIKDEINTAVVEVLESQYFILGPKVKAFEEAVAEYCQCRLGIGVSSGTDAILIAMMAEDIGEGDEVITTPYTFFATAGCIHRAGAKPVFVDIDPLTYNIDPALIEAKITARTKAIMPVHLFGQMAEMDSIMEIANKHGLVVIEDAAQAIGSEYHGKRAGSVGQYGCFSFFPSKNLGGAGDGGMVVTNDPNRAEKLSVMRAHGSKPKYFHKVVGGNFRLDALQAAVLHVKLGHLDEWTEGRQRNAGLYSKLFSDAGMVIDPSEGNLKDKHGVVLPTVTDNCRHIYNQFVIRSDRRDDLMEFLHKKGIVTAIYYPLSLHMQECFAYLGYSEGDFPHSELAARESLALPIYTELTEEMIGYVVDSIAEFHAG